VLKLYKRAAARRDLVDHAVYLGTEGGEELAERFLSQAEASFAVLLDQPQIGSPIAVRDPDLAGIQLRWAVANGRARRVRWGIRPNNFRLARFAGRGGFL